MRKEAFIKLMIQENMLLENMRELIVQTLKEKGKITFTPEDSDEDTADYFDDYPVILMLYGKGGEFQIALTGLYLCENDSITVDGIDIEDDGIKIGFGVYPEHYSGLLLYISRALDYPVDNLQILSGVGEINSEILEIACELAEKELVDTLNLLPSEMQEDGEYREDIQDKFNGLYDKYEERLCLLTGFDYCFLNEQFQVRE